MEMEFLERIGMTRNESIVYITLLRFGTTTTGEILKHAGLNSGKIYEILERLKSKGLASESVINNVRNFTAADPKQLLDWIDRKKSDLEKENEIIKSKLPDLNKIRDHALGNYKFRAVVYTGYDGIKSAVYEALNSMKPVEELLVIGATAKKSERFNKFWLDVSRYRIKRKIIGKHIFSESGSDYINKFRKMTYTQVRVLEEITPSAIDVFGEDKVLIFNYEEPSTCIFIYNRNIAKSFTSFFYNLWKIAKP